MRDGQGHPPWRGGEGVGHGSGGSAEKIEGVLEGSMPRRIIATILQIQGTWGYGKSRES